MAPATWSREPNSEILEVRHVEAVLHVHAGGVQHGIKKLVGFLLELRGHGLVGCGKDFTGFAVAHGFDELARCILTVSPK